MAIFGGGLCVVCFTYNLCSSNWGITCVLAGLCSAIVLSSHDKIYKKHKKSRKSRAYSGYSAAIAGLLAMIMLLAPTVAIKDEFMKIEAISDEMEYARMIVTTILTGGNPKYNKMNTPNKESSAEIADFEPTGAHLFTVGAGSSKRNIYLRSWIGDSFSSSKDLWSMMGEDDYKKMIRQVQGERNGFTGDDITMTFYQLSDILATDFNYGERDYYSNTKLGFVSTYIDVEYVKNTGLLYVLPSSYNSMLGLLEFESRTEGYNQSYSVIGDGVARSTWFNLRKSYTAMTVTPSYIDSDYAENAEMMMKYYSILVEYVNYKASQLGTHDQACEAFEKELKENGIDIPDAKLVLSDYLTQTKKDDWKRKNIRLVASYSSFVKDYYTKVSPTEGLKAVYAELEPLIAEQTTTHGKLMCVIDYLVKNYEYTWTPTKPSGQYESDLDTFLLETKDGYCVQFATAATLLFRMMGYPARYVQGYVASDFNSPEYYMTQEEKEEAKKQEGKEDKDGESYSAPYISRVSDEDAHAWVEVYIDGLGWRTYEPTPVYYTNLYEYKDELSGALDKFEEEVTPPEQDQTTTAPEQTTEPETEKDPETEELPEPVFTFDTKMLVTSLVTLVIAGALLALILWHVRRVNRIVQARDHFIERSVYGSFEDDADRNRVASVLCDSIFEIHYIIGNRPRVGEDPTQFAQRIDSTLPENPTKADFQKQRRASMRSLTLKQASALIQKHEFGKALTREEMAVLGEYLSQLHQDE